MYRTSAAISGFFSAVRDPGGRGVLSASFLVGLLPVIAQGQEVVKPASEIKILEIADEPKLIDPATVMPSGLAASATVDLSDSSLREVIEWLRAEQRLVVLTDSNALAEAGIQSGEPISDRLDNAPIYLLLNRLRASGVAWYFEDEILHITSTEAAEEHLATIPYNLGDLLDAGYDTDDLGQVIESAIAPESWETVGGAGVLSFLGDVMFLRHTGEVHRQVESLLGALRKHGRRTFILDPPQHLLLRQKLNDNVTVAFDDTPLDTAVSELGNQLNIDIRLDLPALRDIRVRERQPVTLKLTDRSLKTVLQSLVMDFDLTWVLRDGVLWITSEESAEAFLKTAVYDVRDLCRDDSESRALREAVMSQTNVDSWNEVGGPGAIEFAKPGTLVISNQESAHMAVLDLLETYRAALRNSKPRDRHAEDPNELITTYYRLHAAVAMDLVTWLPKLVEPESWKTNTKPDAKGTVMLVASPPDLFSTDGQLARLAASDADKTQVQTVVVARSVLIIQQTRAIHEKIVELIQRVESGDALAVDEFEGIGGGGFGGGFFSVPEYMHRAK
ncbi:MAG: DUF4974 domain-containing protein [Planctomycetaceae bacterium]|nr:DUF4974 domain-containing protein [Planctomycetales bacterium]MCB9922916.1 DUF4974 domain-containing protein [Planctomycetaceae bacterium]